MTHHRIAKARAGIKNLKRRANWKIKWGAAATAIFLVLAAIWWLSLPLPQNYETEIPPRPNSYSVTPISAQCSPAGCAIRLQFYALEPAQFSVPEYNIQEISDTGKTVAAFDRVLKINKEFDYGEVANSPLIDSIIYNIKDNRLVIEINRKGAYLPAEISAKESLVSITLPAADKDYPLISGQTPADNSAAFPALHPISFNATLKSPLKSAAIFFQGQPARFETAATTDGDYHFSFNKTLEIDKEYTVKAIITDSANRTVVTSWLFLAQIPSAVALGKDRFKYLGWWGKINADGVAVRKGIAATSDKMGTLSSANRVKVLKEIYGEWINGKNLWYQIDGGMYPGAYIFSDYVTPMAQPRPPQEFAVPDGVGKNEKWIDVDLTKKVLTLFDYDKPIFATYISTGRKENPTITGDYRVWYKLVKTEMKGGPPLHAYRYDLKNVPWTMYYHYDYAIHGTYWHDKFGMAQSAGCTNLTRGDAKFIFENTLPSIPEGKQSVFSRDANNKGTGTAVHNHN